MTVVHNFVDNMKEVLQIHDAECSLWFIVFNHKQPLISSPIYKTPFQQSCPIFKTARFSYSALPLPSKNLRLFIDAPFLFIVTSINFTYHLRVNRKGVSRRLPYQSNNINSSFDPPFVRAATLGTPCRHRCQINPNHF